MVDGVAEVKQVGHQSSCSGGGSSSSSNSSGAASTARAKLAYLLGPASVQTSTARPPPWDDAAIAAAPRCLDGEEKEVQQLQQRVRDLSRQLEVANHANQVFQTHGQDLRKQLAQYTDDIPEIPTEALPASSNRLATRKSEGPRQAVLGISCGRCHGCGTEDIDRDRVFVELRHLYCQKCWSQWERSGWWKPSLRVSTFPPTVRVPGDLPYYVAEDAFFLPGFMCAHSDLSLFQTLKDELPQDREFSEWHGGRHLGCQFEGEGARHDGEKEPLALKAAVAKLEAVFGIRASASRLNLYRTNTDFKPFHCDRGRDQAGIPQVTVGASFGGTRELTFTHINSGLTASFPQRNGDVFAFTPEINTSFMHGVPKIGFGSPSEVEGNIPRLSLILWGAKVTDLDKPL